MPMPSHPRPASGPGAPADEDTCIGLPPKGEPAGRPTSEADDDGTLFAVPVPAPAPPADADDRTLFAVSAAALGPHATGLAPGVDDDGDDRTLFALPTPGAASGDATRRGLAAGTGAPTRLAGPDAEPTLRWPLEGDSADAPTLYGAATPDEATLRMPAPGGQATQVQRPSLAATPAHAPRAGVELQRLVAGVNPLLGAASVLLALVAQLRATGAHADPAGLRAQLLARVAEFEAQAVASGVPRPRISAARYLLCSFLDEVIAATPWGQSWEAHTLLSEFHEERWGGDKAFELLERLGEDPAANAEMLELFYVCLALGFEGRYRGQPDSRARLEAIAERVLQEVRPAARIPVAAARPLSLHWQGVSAPQRPGLHLPPLWSVCVLAAALVLAVLLVWQQRLAAQAQPLLRELHALPAALQPQRAAAAQPAAPARLAPRLQADTAAGALAVRDERLRSVLTLPADALFQGGSAELAATAPALLGRVAQALRASPGQVNVIGHSDDGAAASLQFPSNWHLSRARAQAVLDELARQGVPAERLHAEGRADAEPLAPGRSAAERARNRRVEIELRLPRPEG
ncbi:type IVB secretion system protein IcmH/DotU [Azohydromonas caseinilytica]|uniref:OmpA family protein n=1 Tax=Azohydromonas caseinilytica TaxID=2728836 RepID=A0A848F5H8_9BURK|nr:type IVB secretion system protein IcmH/DotU [Azohydromonas caseinilytica]NML13623.1 OmpA family protein [Azohydromonas caseinilytica]